MEKPEQVANTIVDWVKDKDTLETASWEEVNDGRIMVTLSFLNFRIELVPETLVKYPIPPIFIGI
ncbi:MAG: hypothetical protein V1860_02650 [bacterium]